MLRFKTISVTIIDKDNFLPSKNKFGSFYSKTKFKITSEKQWRKKCLESSTTVDKEQMRLKIRENAIHSINSQSRSKLTDLLLKNFGGVKSSRAL